MIEVPLNSAPDLAQSKPRTGTRLPGLDAGRFVAAAAIIWLHTLAIRPSYAWVADAGRFAVPFFVFSAMVLLGESLRRRRERRDDQSGFGVYVRGRFLRIYVPFLVWTVIYFILRDAKHLIHNSSPGISIDPAVLLVGTTHHLWFLPFIFLLTVIAYPIIQSILSGGVSGKMVAMICLAIGVVICLVPEPISFDVTREGTWEHAKYLLSLGWRTLPCAFWGLAAIPVFGDAVRIVRGRVEFSLFFFGLVVACMWQTMTHPGDFVFANMGGVFFFLSTVGLAGGRVTGIIARGGTYAYSIYLVHVAVLLGLDMIIIRNRETVRWEILVALFVITLIASTAISWSASKVKSLRWAMP